MDAIGEYRTRRQTRIDKRAIENYRKRRNERLLNRFDDEEEPHGNTRIPFGLCQRCGINIGEDWTPWDAWNALAEKGYSADLVYQELRDNGEIGKVTRRMHRKVDESVVRALKPQKDQAVFYSGCTGRNAEGEINKGSDELAREFAETNEGSTMNMLLSDAGVEDWSDEEDDPMGLWRDASRVMAQNARGNVRVLIKQPLRKGNIFEAVELPTLKKNPYVTRIVTIDIDTGEEKEIFRR